MAHLQKCKWLIVRKGSRKKGSAQMLEGHLNNDKEIGLYPKVNEMPHMGTSGKYCVLKHPSGYREWFAEGQRGLGKPISQVLQKFR